jgi:hypothetical protein
VTIIPSEYNLGKVGHEDRVLGVARIVNEGKKTLTIRSVRSNCGCYRVSSSVRSLLPGESAVVEFNLTFPRGKRLRNPIIGEPWK